MKGILAQICINCNPFFKESIYNRKSVELSSFMATKPYIALDTCFAWRGI